MINPNAITYTCTRQGYMLYYKGIAIGGAGTDTEKTPRWTNVKLYKEQAEIEKQRLLGGIGRPSMYDAIREIDNKPMVYVVEQSVGCSIGSRTFVGAYSTFEKAEEAKQEHYNKHICGNYEIHCIELDKMIDKVYMDW